MPLTTFVPNNNNFTLPSMVKKNVFKPNGVKMSFRKASRKASRKNRKNRTERKNRKNRKNTRKN